MDDVLRHAGAGPEAIDRGLDLEDLFCAVYEHERDRMLERYDRATAGLTSWRDRLRATAYELYCTMKADRKLAHFLVVEVQTAGDRAMYLQWEGVEKMFDLLDEGRSELDDPDEISRETAELIAGGIFEHLIRTVATQEWPPADEIVPQGMYIAVLPYVGQEAAEEELRIAAPPDAT